MKCPVCDSDNLKFVEDFSSNFVTISDAVVRYPIKYIQCLDCDNKIQDATLAQHADESYRAALQEDVE